MKKQKSDKGVPIDILRRSGLDSGQGSNTFNTSKLTLRVCWSKRALYVCLLGTEFQGQICNIFLFLREVID